MNGFLLHDIYQSREALQADLAIAPTSDGARYNTDIYRLTLQMRKHDWVVCEGQVQVSNYLLGGDVGFAVCIKKTEAANNPEKLSYFSSIFATLEAHHQPLRVSSSFQCAHHAEVTLAINAQAWSDNPHLKNPDPHALPCAQAGRLCIDVLHGHLLVKVFRSHVFLL